MKVRSDRGQVVLDVGPSPRQDVVLTPAGALDLASLLRCLAGYTDARTAPDPPPLAMSFRGGVGLKFWRCRPQFRLSRDGALRLADDCEREAALALRSPPAKFDPRRV